jgi:hypothetical protein
MRYHFKWETSQIFTMLRKEWRIDHIGRFVEKYVQYFQEYLVNMFQRRTEIVYYGVVLKKIFAPLNKLRHVSTNQICSTYSLFELSSISPPCQLLIFMY